MKADDPSDETRRSRLGAAKRGGVLHPLDWAAASGAKSDVLQELERQLSRRRQRWRMGAGLVSLLLLGSLIWWWQPAPAASGVPTGTPSSLVVSAPARHVLDDGSIVELRQGAEFEVEFNERQRRVALKHGEAHFEVAKNPDRPFIVDAGGIEVRAVGTAFVVHAANDAVQVVVTEGRVAIDRNSSPPASHTEAPAAAPLLLDAGGSASLAGAAGAAASTPQVSTLSATEIAERLAWRVPTIEFSGTPLPEVIAAVNRHAPVRLVLEDRSLERVRLSGVLRADNVDTLVRLLEEEHGLRATRREPAEIRLSRGR